MKNINPFASVKAIAFTVAVGLLELLDKIKKVAQMRLTFVPPFIVAIESYI